MDIHTGVNTFMLDSPVESTATDQLVLCVVWTESCLVSVAAS